MFDAAKYDIVEKNDKTKGITQFMADLPSTANDTAAFKHAVKHYGVNDENDFYNLHDPTD